MKNVTIGRYQVSVGLLLVALVICPIVGAATFYLWTWRSVPLSIDEPLSIVDFPSLLHAHPGENITLSIAIQNDATVDYSVNLEFSLNDTQYQLNNAEFSNLTYPIMPGTNNITAWLSINKHAPQASLLLNINFTRK